MTQSRCDRWAALSDARALGERLEPVDLSFVERHASSCPHCGREAQLWAALGESLEDGPVHEAPKDISVSPLDDASAKNDLLRAPHAKLMLSLAAGVLLAGATALVWSRVHSSESAPSNQPRVAESTAQSAHPIQLALVAGDVRVGGALASAGASLVARDVVEAVRGRACLADGNGGFSCTQARTRLQIQEQPNERRLRLESGGVVCRQEAQADGRLLSVETSQGVASSPQGLFAVEQKGPDVVELRVHRGAVSFVTTNGERKQIRGPARTMLVRSAFVTPQERTPLAFAEDEQAIAVAELWNGNASAPLDVIAHQKNAQVELDGVLLGMAPVSMLVSRGKHALSVDYVEAGKARSVQKEIRVLGAERLVEQVELASPPTEGNPDASDQSRRQVTPPAVTQASSAAEMLKHASTLRAAREYGKAARAYEQLVAKYPNRREATIALLSLAELQLSTLQNPGAALRSFDAYLARGGSLKQEAEYGRIRALRRLGEDGAATEAARRFVSRYPDSLQAESLRQRSTSVISK